MQVEALWWNAAESSASNAMAKHAGAECNVKSAFDSLKVWKVVRLMRSRGEMMHRQCAEAVGFFGWRTHPKRFLD